MDIMKDFDIRIRNGGDDAIAAACELSGLAKERRGYEETMAATGSITDIVTVLRGVGFSSVSPQAGESASLLHYCVTHAADEIEHLREAQRWIPVTKRLPEEYEIVMVGWEGRRDIGKGYLHHGKWHDPLVCVPDVNQPTHWQPLPAPPTASK